MPEQDLISEFLSYLESEQRASLHTVEAYGRDLNQFSEWIFGNDLHQWDGVSVSDIREWIGNLADTGLSSATLRRKSQSLRAFYRWGHKKGTFSSNPARELPLVKKSRHLPNFIKEREIEDLLSTKDSANHFVEGQTDAQDSQEEFNKIFVASRRHIVITLLYSLGLRQAELLNLKDTDFSSDGRELKVLGKRNKQRVIPIPDALFEEVREWQKIRDLRYPELPSPRPLIAGHQGSLSKAMLYRIVRDGLEGLSTGRKSPHTLRHTFATTMLNHGADIDAVREMLGHASLQTTQIYTHVSYKELLANYRTAHPRAGNGKIEPKK